MIVKSVLLRIISFIVACVMLIPVGAGKTEKYDVKDPENCELNFSVLSDSHIEGNNFNRFKVFARSLQDVKKNKSGNDAIVFLGDNTMNGQNIENMLFHGACSIILKGENIFPVMGNHDIGNGEGDYAKLQNRWYSYSNAFFGRDLKHPYYYDIVDGCYFIVLGMEAQEVYEMMVTEEQFAWLENVLKEAAETGRPAFVFSHYPMDDAVDETGRTTDRLVNMMAEYNRENDIFVFVGHTHMPMYLFWSFHTYDGYPETYMPRLTDLAGSDDHEIYDNSGVGAEVEVYNDEVVIRSRNFYTGEWRYEEDEGQFCEKTYQLKNPLN